MPGKGTLGERLARHRCSSLPREYYYYDRLYYIAPLCVVPRPAGVAPCGLYFLCTLVGFPECQLAAHDAEDTV